MRIKSLFRKFIESGSSGGIILILCVITSLVLANTALGVDVYNILHTKVGLESIGLKLSLLHWVNDGFMAIFFLLVGLEIKRELAVGELSSVRKAMLPILAATGGVIVPALIFTMFTFGTDYSRGWGIPVATDIAFALAVLAMLSKRIPVGLRIFLTAFAIVDDLWAIIIVAAFYTSELDLFSLSMGLAIFGLLVFAGIRRVGSMPVYIIGGLFIWYFIYLSGIHPTLAGVLTAFAMPFKAKDGSSPLMKLEHSLTNPVNYIIMPVFAFANTNIVLDSGLFEGVESSLALGVCCGLIFGKPLGIFIFSWLSTRLKISNLPLGVKWGHILGAGIIGGIGFTMSIFISILSFENSEAIQNQAKVLILVASVFAGVCGYLYLWIYSKYNMPKVKNSNAD